MHFGGCLGMKTGSVQYLLISFQSLPHKFRSFYYLGYMFSAWLRVSGVCIAKSQQVMVPVAVSACLLQCS